MSRYEVLLCIDSLRAQLNQNLFSTDYIQEGRWKGCTTCLGWRMSEHWPPIICGRSTLASKPQPALPIQGHSWSILASGIASIRTHPFDIILICLTCWLCLKKWVRPWNQCLLFGYRIWEATHFKIVDYGFCSWSTGQIFVLKRRGCIKTSSHICFVFISNLFDFLSFDTSVHYFWDPFGASAHVRYGIHHKITALGRYSVHYYWAKILDFRIQPLIGLSGGL